MDFYLFILLTAVLIVLGFVGYTGRVLCGIGLILLGAVALGGVEMGYYHNGTIIYENLVEKDSLLILPLIYVFGGIAMLSSLIGFSSGGDYGSWFRRAD